MALQARVWEPAATAMLREIGVAGGWRCVDLGCGPRGVLRPLSTAAGPLGVTIGIDEDPVFLSAARTWTNDQAMHNVWLLQDDACDTDLPHGCFDLVHARFVLSTREDDARLLKEMIALTRPGGVIALQEPDSASWDCHPRRAGWDALKPAILRACRAGGGDFDAGRRLYSMLRQAGLEDVQVAAHVLTLPHGHAYRRAPVQFATALREPILKGGLLSPGQFDAALADCEAAADDSNSLFTTFTLMQAWGRKA